MFETGGACTVLDRPLMLTSAPLTCEIWSRTVSGCDGLGLVMTVPIWNCRVCEVSVVQDLVLC